MSPDNEDFEATLMSNKLQQGIAFVSFQHRYSGQLC